MANWRNLLTKLGFQTEKHFDTLTERLQRRLGADEPVQLLAYLGHGNTQTLYLTGRVLEGREILAASDSDTVWQNLLASYQRFQTRELPNVRVEARYGELAQTSVTDDEGYYAFDLRLTEPLLKGAVWQTVAVRTLDAIGESQPVQTEGAIMVPPQRCTFGVISDIDDTILQSHATHLLKMARLLFLGNARTRLPFAGVAAFYRALQQGVREDGYHPFFYVSSSPWNMYDLLVDFMNLQGIPRGPLFLRDYDLERKRLLPFGHQEYKLERIRHILDVHANLRFLLIGDSGQEDPEIYRQVVKEYPGRILAIYIRDVSRERRDAQVNRLFHAAQSEGVEMLLVPDTVAAAQHAAAHGWIEPSALPGIEADQRNDQAEPTKLEQIMEGE